MTSKTYKEIVNKLKSNKYHNYLFDDEPYLSGKNKNKIVYYGALLSYCYTYSLVRNIEINKRNIFEKYYLNIYISKTTGDEYYINLYGLSQMVLNIKKKNINMSLYNIILYDLFGEYFSSDFLMEYKNSSNFYMLAFIIIMHVFYIEAVNDKGIKKINNWKDNVFHKYFLQIRFNYYNFIKTFENIYFNI